MSCSGCAGGNDVPYDKRCPVCFGLSPTERQGTPTKLLSTDLPPLVMADNGQLDEGSISVLTAVSLRLGQQVEFLRGRAGSIGTTISAESRTAASLRRRLKLTLAAYEALHKLHWNELP